MNRAAPGPVAGSVPDLLPGLRSLTLPLGSPGLVGTLVFHPADRVDAPAVLYLHGYNDYFFQDELAARWRAAGYAFFALDLRRHGRSLRPGNQPCWIDSMSDYFVELDWALEQIQGRRSRPLLLLGHSTGGLTAALYARARPGALEGLILNSPFFSFAGTAPERWLLREVVTPLAAVAPRVVVQADGGPLYASSLHKAFGRGGEWEYDLTWKRAGGLPILAGWIRAIEQAQAQVRAGLGLRCPVLVLSSARSGGGAEWNPSFTNSDAVLRVKPMRRLARRLGPQVDQVVLDGALHDVVLSAPEVRERAYEAMLSWADAALSRP